MRARRSVMAVALSGLSALGLSASQVLLPLPALAQGTAIQAVVVGDSITVGYGPYFEKKFEARALGKGHWLARSATNPCSHPWAQWLRDFPKERLDYVVVQDHYIQGAAFEGPCPSEDAWRAAWQDLVDAAKEKSAFVIVLAGNHPDLSTVQRIDILDYPVPPPDYGDGVHYTNAGNKLYAKNVVDLLADLLA